MGSRKQGHRMTNANKHGEKGYDKAIRMLIDKAERKGLIYDTEMEEIACKYCDQTWVDYEEYHYESDRTGVKHNGDCRNTTLDDYMTFAKPIKVPKGTIKNGYVKSKGEWIRKTVKADAPIDATDEIFFGTLPAKINYSQTSKTSAPINAERDCDVRDIVDDAASEPKNNNNCAQGIQFGSLTYADLFKHSEIQPLIEVEHIENQMVSEEPLSIVVDVTKEHLDNRTVERVCEQADDFIYKVVTKQSGKRQTQQSQWTRVRKDEMIAKHTQGTILRDDEFKGQLNIKSSFKTIVAAKKAKAVSLALNYDQKLDLYTCPNCCECALLAETLVSVEHTLQCMNFMQKLGESNVKVFCHNSEWISPQKKDLGALNHQFSLATINSITNEHSLRERRQRRILDGEENIITKINVCADDEEQYTDNDIGNYTLQETKLKQFGVKKKRVNKKSKERPWHQQRKITIAHVDDLIDEAVSVCLENNIPIEIIGKNAKILTPKNIGEIRTVAIPTIHQLTGNIVPADIPLQICDYEQYYRVFRAIRRVTLKLGYESKLMNSDFKPGTSGCFILREWLNDKTLFSTPQDGEYVVRGRDNRNGKIISSLWVSEFVDLLHITHYSSINEDNDLDAFMRLAMNDDEEQPVAKQVVNQHQYVSMQNPNPEPTAYYLNQCSVNSEYTYTFGVKRDFVDQLRKRFFEDQLDDTGHIMLHNRATNTHVRELSTEALRMVMDTQQMKEQRRGKRILVENLQDACRPSQDGFYHTWCGCQTNAYGTIYPTRQILPIPNALLTGHINSPLYINLPELEGSQILAPKEGYCYLIIFLHMLVALKTESLRAFISIFNNRVVVSLGKWPTFDQVITWVATFVRYFPELAQATVPFMFVHHASRTIHFIDSLGSLTYGYHQLAVQSMGQLLALADPAMRFEVLQYNVGGLVDRVKRTICLIRDEKQLLIEMQSNPLMVFYALSSPTLLRVLHRSKVMDKVLIYVIEHEESYVDMILKLNHLCEKISRSASIQEDVQLWQQAAEPLLHDLEAYVASKVDSQLRTYVIESRLQYERLQLDNAFRNSGHRSEEFELIRKKEEHLIDQFNKHIRASSYYSEFIKMNVFGSSYEKLTSYCTTSQNEAPVRTILSSGKSRIDNWKSQLKRCSNFANRQITRLKTRIIETTATTCSTITYSIVKAVMGRSFSWFNVLNAVSLLITIINFLNIVVRYKRSINEQKIHMNQLKTKILVDSYHAAVAQYQADTAPEILDREALDKLYDKFNELNPSYVEQLNQLRAERLQFQTKEEGKTICRVFAFVTLCMMFFDVARADLMYKSFSQIKGLMATLFEKESNSTFPLTFQSDTQSIQNVMDVIIQQPDVSTSLTQRVLFGDWFNKCTENGRLIPTLPEAKVLDFTRNTAHDVVGQITTSTNQELQIRGFVGSGKSTFLPHLLSKHGKVLICQPVRVLANNVYQNLCASPFYQSPSLFMRGVTQFGSGNITIATSGYAAAYYCENRERLHAFDYIIIDESHIISSDVLLLRSLMRAIDYQGRVLYTSATPIGNEIPFKTMHPVEVVTTSRITIDEFAQAQGTKTKYDVTNKGENVLVYVASFSEVDKLSSLLVARSHYVKKVDSRTMITNVNVDCDGSAERPLFIVATNIVENGVTLNVDVVVDFGTCVVPVLQPATRDIAYVKQPITYGQRIQRNGRVGRFKRGYCLNIGDVNRLQPPVSESVATEGALKCFRYNLPPPVDGVEFKAFQNITRDQIATAMQFELVIFLIIFLINCEGKIHKSHLPIVKKYLLRETQIQTTSDVSHIGIRANWNLLSKHMSVEEIPRKYANVRIPFFAREFGMHDYLKIGVATLQAESEQSQNCFRTYGDPTDTLIMLQTDPNSIQRSIDILESELILERRKLSDLDLATSNTTGMLHRLASSVLLITKRRWQRETIVKNIHVLESARLRLLAINQSMPTDITDEPVMKQFIDNNPEITMVLSFQSSKTHAEQLKALGVVGRYDYARITSDVFGILIICAVVLYCVAQWFIKDVYQRLQFQGKKFDRLRMRDHKYGRMGYNIGGRDQDMGEIFGDAYRVNVSRTKKQHDEEAEGPSGCKGLGKKLKPYQTFYHFDPSDYDILEIYDPITGRILTMNPNTNSRAIELEIESAQENTDRWGDFEMPARVKATFKKLGHKNEVLKQLQVDMTQHQATRVTGRGGIMGYPNHQGEYRQTGEPRIGMNFEAKSSVSKQLHVTPFQNAMCTLVFHYQNSNEVETLRGIQTHNLMVTNAHVFSSKVTQIDFITQHGCYQMKNREGIIQIIHVDTFDAIILSLPPDMPVGRKIKAWRKPKHGEAVVMLKVYRRSKELESTIISDRGIIKSGPGCLWYHNISTENGDCGSPLISTTDNQIIGFHGGIAHDTDQNFFTPVSDELLDLIKAPTTGFVTNDWVWDVRRLNLGAAIAERYQPAEPFPVVHPLRSTMQFQGKRKWVSDDLPENIQLKCELDTFFNTRHTYKGEHDWFREYLRTNSGASDYFSPYMNKYQPSALNGEAFKKDFFKYGKPTVVGEVNMQAFKAASERVIRRFELVGFKKGTIKFEFNPLVILQDLNYQAAMGAQYKGKKGEYLDTISIDDFTTQLAHSCYRLKEYKEGVWKGSLKAELRPNEKVLQNKTRVFTSAPYDVLIGAKCCVHNFNKAFYAQHTKGPWTVGINKLNKGWHKLITSLPENWQYGTGDGSQFDSSLTPLLINEVCRIRQYFMEPHPLGHQMLSSLYKQIVWTLISMPDGTVVRKNKGNPSGQPSTVDDNTMMVMLAVEYTFECLKISFDHTNEIFKYYCNGDDIMYAIRPDKSALLNEFTHTFAHLGLNYIFEEQTTNKEELEYMSLTPMLYDGIYIPKLCRERIVSILQWRHSGDTRANFDAINAALVESWGYPDLSYWIRNYYTWLLKNNYDSGLEYDQKIPYHTDNALRNLYMCDDEYPEYDGRYDSVIDADWEGVICRLEFQSSTSTDDMEIGTTGTTTAITSSGVQTTQAPRARASSPDPQATQSGHINPLGQTGTVVTPVTSQLTTQPITTLPPFTPLYTASDPQPSTQRFQPARSGQPSARGGRGRSSSVRGRGRGTNPQGSFFVRADDFAEAEPNQSTPGEQPWDELELPDIPNDQVKARIPLRSGNPVFSHTQMFGYRPPVGSLAVNKATTEQLEAWYNQISEYFGMEDISALMLGFMAWCIENGTSPNVLNHGRFKMVNTQGEERTYSLEPFRTTSVSLRSLMRHYSGAAIDYINARKHQDPNYRPRLAAKRGLRQESFTPYAFDFLDETTLSPDAIEIVHQMKAAALEGANTRALNLDGSTGQNINTERHTAADTATHVHNVRGSQLLNP